MTGFLPGSRASFMFDVVAGVMLVVLPLVSWNIWLVKKRRAYGWHKRLQICLGLILLVTVGFFEMDVRRHDWHALAAPSPFYKTWLMPYLAIHLTFAVTTTLLWIVTLLSAWRRFPDPPRPAAHSTWHKRLGWLTAIGTFCTALTGWGFYWMAFVA